MHYTQESSSLDTRPSPVSAVLPCESSNRVVKVKNPVLPSFYSDKVM